MDRFRQCMAPWKLLVIAAILVGGLGLAQPARASLRQAQPGLRDVGAIPSTAYSCIDPTTPNTLLVSYNIANDAGLAGTYTYNWASGKLTRLSEQPFMECDPASGLLYGFSSTVGAPELLADGPL